MSEEEVSLVLLLLIVIVEKQAQLDRKWLLDTYVECLAAVHMEKVVVGTY